MLSNCNWEKVRIVMLSHLHFPPCFDQATVCAFNNATTADQVSFLACMDEKAGNALSAAKKCVKGTSIDDGSLEKRYNGREGQALLQAASKVWNKQFPSRATVPHTFVDGTNVQASYAPLKKALCKAGAKANVCNDRLGSGECAI